MLSERCSNAWFRFVHGRHLVYNSCWEDPRLDREALELDGDDTVLVITSAGCNALDYALDGPAHVYAVDVNPCQNALLELKLAGIRALEHDEFFAMFGTGRFADWPSIYARRLRAQLSPSARQYWDNRGDYFSGTGWCSSFYFHGTAGWCARLVKQYLDRVVKLHDAVDALLHASSLSEQRAVYFESIKARFWNRLLRYLLNCDTFLALLGVPRAQRCQLERDYAGGVAKFVEDALDAVFGELPIHDNYFWRVYLTGRHTSDCCPEYLKPGPFARLKAGLVDRVSVHTATVAQFLRQEDVAISRYVLLDHMDWLADRYPEAVAEEWEGILARSRPQARVLWRSAGLRSDFVDQTEIQANGRRLRIRELLSYHRRWAAELHRRDRVHTYGSFYIADLLRN